MISPLTPVDVRRYRDIRVFQRLLWPDVKLYDRQWEMLVAVKESSEVYVPAGNKLGKDFTAGYLALSFFLCPMMYFEPEYVREVDSWRSPTNPYPHTVRVVTTSVKDDHLRVLWGEIGRFVDTARADTPLGPLRERDGGPLVMNHRDYRKKVGYLNGSGNGTTSGGTGTQCKISYLRGMVSESGEGLAGHHAAYTLLVADEASGTHNKVLEQGRGWAKRIFAIGNPNPCPKTQWFRAGCDGGDLLREVA